MDELGTITQLINDVLAFAGLEAVGAKYASIFTLGVAAALAVIKITPTKEDDKWLNKILLWIKNVKPRT